MSMLISIGLVRSVFDDADGLRIKADVIQDKKTESTQAFPLLPKTMQTMPKEGEAVLILYGQINNQESQRYYIGPIIPQPQFMAEAKHTLKKDETSIATCLLHGGDKSKVLTRISNYAETAGAFPEKEDVALVGRHSEDIILKDKEINIRCGVRTRSENDDNNLVGDVIFNSQNPGYIQMKFRKSAASNTSIINMVSDKLNLLSYGNATKASTSIPYTNPSSKTNKVTEHLIKEQDLDTLMSQLHPIPYGDVIVNAFKLIIQAIETHKHTYPGTPPTPDTQTILTKVFEKEFYNPDIQIN